MLEPARIQAARRRLRDRGSRAEGSGPAEEGPLFGEFRGRCFDLALLPRRHGQNLAVTDASRHDLLQNRLPSRRDNHVTRVQRLPVELVDDVLVLVRIFFPIVLPLRASWV